MIRSLLAVSRPVYTCLVVPSITHGSRLPLQNAIHSTAMVQVLSKDHPMKHTMKQTLRKDVKESTPQLDADEDEDGFNPGNVFPTLESPSMVIGNVKYSELPIVHIKATHNNTLVGVTKHTGKMLHICTAGSEGFRNARKGTNIAAQAAGMGAGKKAFAKGLTNVRIVVKGIGPGRLPAIKGLQMGGLTVVSITDNTPMPFNGNRPRKARRV